MRLAGLTVITPNLIQYAVGKFESVFHKQERKIKKTVLLKPNLTQHSCQYHYFSASNVLLFDI